MTALQIILLVVGLVCIVGSFFVSEKLSSSDLEEMKKLSEQELKIILEKEMQGASDTIEERLQEKLDAIMEDLERKGDLETNQKIMAISEYSDTVLNSMNKSHDEIVFMYDMLGDKQEKVTELTKEIQMMESAILQMEQVLDEKISFVQEEAQKEIQISPEEIVIQAEQIVSMEDALQTQVAADVNNAAADNARILSLYQEGLSEVEIAKQLGRGLGEVKLVLGLFSEGTKE